VLNGTKERFTRDELSQIRSEIESLLRALDSFQVVPAIYKSGPLEMTIELSPEGLSDLLNSFSILTIATKTAEYAIPLLTAALSPVLVPHLDSKRFLYDGDDESFEIVSDYLKLEGIAFHPSTIDSVLRIATDLGLSHLREAVSRVREEFRIAESVFERHHPAIC
jgi:hypothetical protein